MKFGVIAGRFVLDHPGVHNKLAPECAAADINVPVRANRPSEQDTWLGLLRR